MIPKNTSWKHAFTCQNCGTLSPGRKGAANRFCKNDCQHEFSVKRWIECSKCLARMGIGSKIAGRLLGISGSTVTRGWQNQGIVSVRPKSGSIVRDGRSISTKIKDQKQSLWREYERAWMRQMREEERSFPNWGILHKPKMSEKNREKNREKANAHYHAMTPEEKRMRNLRCMQLRKKRHELDPDSKRRHRERMNEWKKRNPEKRKAYQKAGAKKWLKKRKIIDPGFRVQLNLRHRLKDLMKTARKGGSSSISSLMGCSTKQLANHLESQFKRGMKWENYGTKWHVDHILPCASFDHTDPKQVAQCWHWTNLRPLDAKRNMDKGATIEEPQMSLLLCASH